MAEDEDKVGERWPSEAELAQKERLEQDDTERVGALQGSPGTVSEVNDRYAVEDNDTSGYVGVSSEYMTYANDTEKPLRAEEGVEAELEDKLLRGGLVSKVAVGDGKQTQGGGSTYESVTTATSGDGFSSKVASQTPDKATVGRPASRPSTRPAAPESRS